MTKVKVLCLGCQKHFDFNHPSVRTTKDLQRITITCPHCGKSIVAAQFHMVMEPIERRTQRALAQGNAIHKQAEELAKGSGDDFRKGQCQHLIGGRSRCGSTATARFNDKQYCSEHFKQHFKKANEVQELKKKLTDRGVTQGYAKDLPRSPLNNNEALAQLKAQLEQENPNA